MTVNNPEQEPTPTQIKESLDEVLTPEYKDFIRVLAQSVRSEVVIIDDETAVIREIEE